MKRVQTGIETFLLTPPKWIKGQRIGLLCNPASVDANFQHSRLLIEHVFPGQIKALFSPQHGLFSEKQDNMIESDHTVDPVLGVPAFSLYGETRCPDQDMYDLIDTLIVDLQDVGTRVYTFTSTLSYCMEAARRYDKKVLVLDRPNPLGGSRVEGNCLLESYRSFVGRYPIPMRHGLTIAEYARMINDHFEIGCDLHISPMKGWKRSMFFTDTGLPWIAPSPNLPTPVSAAVYPGQVIWEGTNVSEGRGTSQPFECFGAPYIVPEKLLSHGSVRDLPGVHLRETAFEPTANKWKGQLCKGLHIHILDPEAYKPYETTVRLLQSVINSHTESFQWKIPPYEYEYEKRPIDLILGDPALRKQLENNKSMINIPESWKPGLEQFKTIAKDYHLYKND